MPADLKNQTQNAARTDYPWAVVSSHQRPGRTSEIYWAVHIVFSVSSPTEEHHVTPSRKAAQIVADAFNEMPITERRGVAKLDHTLAARRVGWL